MTLQCPICMECPRVPVKFICFPCTKRDPSRPSCHSMSRSCLVCARNYLELNKAKETRSHRKKCLFCPEECYPEMLNASRAYEKDFLLMSMDTEKTHKCHSCDFTGGQTELDHHLRLECPDRFEYCTHCRKSFQVSDNEHKRSCPLYVNCRMCPDYILADKIQEHYQSAHSRRLCSYCTGLFPMHEEHECGYQVVSCTICHANIFMKNRASHYQDHVADCRGSIGLLRTELAMTEAQLHHYETTPHESFFKSVR